ncbi:hypothetical protein [Pedobacter suwonensis]|nr:hypothetical protein [Pedobacter suwonensis]
MKTKKLNKRTLFVFKKNYINNTQAVTTHSEPTTTSATSTISSGVIY